MRTSTQKPATPTTKPASTTSSQRAGTPTLQDRWSGSKNYSAGPDSLDGARSTPLRRGMSGPAVLDMQKKLNAAGMKPPLAEDGLLGPRSEAAIAKFSRANGLGSVRSFGSAGLDALNSGGSFDAVSRGGGQSIAPTEQDLRTAPSGARKAADFLREAMFGGASKAGGAQGPGRADRPFDGDVGSREAQAEQLLRQNGAWPPEEGRTYVIQIDQDQPPASASSQDRLDYVRSYSGQTAVFKAEGGRMVEQEAPMRSASHPGQKSTNGRYTDVDGDGASDIAHLRGGVYDYRSRPNGSGRYNPVDNRSMSVARDTNHDGVISDSENARSAQDGHYATALQWHAGGRNRPSSVGCQTMAPGDFQRFQSAVGEGNGDSFTYLLVRRPSDLHGANPL